MSSYYPPLHKEGACGALLCRRCRRLSLQRLVRCAVLCALLAVVSCALCSKPAAAATWPTGSSRHSVELGFHETYTAGVSNSSYVHSGLDATASAGSQILCPVAGTVSFTGSIPSGDSSLNEEGAEKTMKGVSLKLSDGRTLTLLPLESITVSKGEHVLEGQPIGVLAASGDRSSTSPHLHMGLKQGRTYYNPLELFPTIARSGKAQAKKQGADVLTAKSSKASSSGTEQAEEVTHETPQAQAAPEGQRAGSLLSDVLEQNEVLSAHTSSAGAAAGVRAGSQRLADGATEERFGSISSGSEPKQHIGKQSSTSEGSIKEAVLAIAGASHGQATSLVVALAPGFLRFGLPIMGICAACTALLFALMSGKGRAFGASFVRCVANLWKRIRIVLVSTETG